MIVRSCLHRLGYRFRLHVAELPGSPDLVLPKHRTVILVHGCFWHRHTGCKLTYTVKSNRAFWNTKFSANKARDRQVREALKARGWRVIVLWQCQTREAKSLARRLQDKLAPG